MVYTNKADFKRKVDKQNSEGTVFSEYEPTLTDIDCNLQEDDSFSTHGPYGRTNEDDTFTLFLEKTHQPYIQRGDRVIIDGFDTYSVEKVFRNYVTHVELLLKSGVNSG